MRIATLLVSHKDKYLGALMATGFVVYLTDAMPVGCDPDWLFLQITQDSMPTEWN